MNATHPTEKPRFQLTVTPSQLAEQASHATKEAEERSAVARELEAKVAAHSAEVGRLTGIRDGLVERLHKAHAQADLYRARAADCRKMSEAISGGVHHDLQAWPNATLGARDADYLADECLRCATVLEQGVLVASGNIEAFLKQDALATATGMVDKAKESAALEPGRHAEHLQRQWENVRK